ncbi:MAG TPA: hypothetical protein VHR41_12330 [Gemmatimonadales bacterium]|jgi:hypothetical protein|nr:hypothetical protein [Gemmatimonadales bacterium]
MLAQSAAVTILATLLAVHAGTEAPLTAKYRVDQTLTQEIDATSAGKGKQSLSFTTSSFLTLTLTDSVGGKAVKVVVDSMRADSTAPIPANVFDSARGSEYHGFLSAAGKLSELELVSSSAAAAKVQGFLSDFFPWVKAGVKVGEHWADTSSKTTANGSDSVVVKRIVAYHAMGNETRNARKAVRIASQYSSNVLGTQPTPNGPAKIEGTGSGTGVYFVSPDGTYLGGDWRLQSALKISGAFADNPLPITITQTTKVTALK